MKGKVIVLIGANILLGCTLLAAQQATSTASDDFIQEMRKDLRSDKKVLVAANLSLTESEATKFWPVYDQYAVELAKINDKKLIVIKEYAAKYESLSSDEAQELIKKWNEADDEVIQLRAKYVPKFHDVLHSKKTARFFQLDRRIGLVLDLQLASEIPLVEQ